MAEKKDKKSKIEISKLTLIFIILFGLCLMIWSFIIGVWVGSKLGVNEEKLPLEEKGGSFESFNTTSSVFSSNKTQNNETKNFVVSRPLAVESNKTHVQTVHKEIFQKKRTEKKSVEKKKRFVKKYIKRHFKSRYFYTIQVGAFSKKSSVENLKRLARSKGYQVMVRINKIKGKIIYKVFVGRYKTRKEAKKHIFKISRDLGIKGIFVVKIKR